MSEELARLLDLKTAWKRVKHDIISRIFIRSPYAVSVIELDLENWLQTRLDLIQTSRYSPASMFVCDVPKGKGLIRPGSHLTHSDRVIFAACVGACFPMIHETLRWSQGSVDFSYRLAADPRNAEWVRGSFEGWKEFQDKSTREIDNGASHVVIADIASFYENIDIGLLISDLRASRSPEAAVAQISTCLNRWAQVSGRGIPQGQSASDILAKLYMDNIDRVLKDMGYRHIRYVDDIRVFCTTLVEAKRLLIDLSRLLRKRGLNVQSAKSKIYEADVAREKIDEVTRVVRNVKQQFVADVADDPYTSVHEADELLDKHPDEAPLEIIQNAYQNHIVENIGEFNATLFHFLLNRLGKQRDSFAAQHSVGLLIPHPEETGRILKYLRATGPGEEIESQIIELMNSHEMVYQYHFYEIIEWFYEGSSEASPRLIEWVRRSSFDPNTPRYLRTICRAFLGKFGTSADLERIAAMYDETNDACERSEIICSIQRMERGRRNAFLARVEHESSPAVRWVRSLG